MERLSRGELFDGMESWLPWLAPDEIVLPDLLAPDSRVLLCEPRRLADRAADIKAETDDLTQSLAVTWGLRSPGRGHEGCDIAPDDAPAPFPPLHVAFDRLLAHCPAAVWSVDSTAAPTADGLPGPHIATEPWLPAAGDPTRLVRQLRRLVTGAQHHETSSAQHHEGGGTARPIVVVAAEGDSSAARLADALSAEEVPLRLHVNRAASPRRPAVTLWWRPSKAASLRLQPEWQCCRRRSSPDAAVPIAQPDAGPAWCRRSRI